MGLMVTRLLRLAVVIAAALSVTVTSHAAAGVEVVSVRLPFAGASDPSCFDLDWDGRQEVLVSGAGGEVAAFASDGLKRLWLTRVSDKSMTPVVAGDFAGAGAPMVAVASSDGSVYFLDGTTGGVLASASVGVPVILAPTVVPLGPLDGTDREGVVVCDDRGGVHLVTFGGSDARVVFHVPNTVETPDGGGTRRVALGRVTRPASVGDVTGNGVPEILVGTVNGAVQAIPLNRPEGRILWFAAQGTHIDTSICVADLFGTGRNNIAFGTRPGDLFVLEYDGGMGFREVRREKLLGAPNGHLVVADLDGDGFPDIAGATQSMVVAFEGRASLTRYEKPPHTSVGSPTSPSSIVGVQGHGPVALLVDSRGTVLLVEPRDGTEVARYAGAEPFSHVAPAGNLDGSGRLAFVCLGGDRSRLSLVRMEERIDPTWWPPTLTYGGGFRRDGLMTKTAADRLAAQKARADASVAKKLEAARTALEAGRRGEARELADAVLRVRPSEAGAQEIVAKVTRLRRVAVNALALVALAASGVVAGRMLLRRRGRRRAARLADEAAGRGDHATAIDGYRRAVAGDPRNQRLQLALAEAMLAAGQRDGESIAVFARAREVAPDRSEFTVALAEAHAAAGNETDEALDAYMVALALMEAGKGPVAFRAGNIMRARGELDKAMRYYKTAYGANFREPELFRELVAIYLELGQFSDKTLPVFERIADERRDDPVFLEGLCRCCLAARRVDETARRAATDLMALIPDDPAAARLMARCELHAGRADHAAELAAKARSAESDPEILELLAQCYLALERRDNEAVAIYREALETSPENPDLLRVVASVVLEGGGPLSDGDYAIVRRACAANAYDAELLAGLAGEAARRDDRAVVIDALERTLALGQQSPESWCMLADAYTASGDTPPEGAERALREALRLQGDNVVYLRALARLLAAQGRTDPDTMLVLERAFQRDNSDMALGRHLAKSLMANGRLDDVLKLVRWLLQHDKENGELQRLHAQASLSNNRIDEAVRQYEHLLAQHPDDREAVVNLARALAEKQRTDDAAAARYAAALVFEPEIVPVRLMLARHHALAGRVEKAVEEFRAAGKPGPDAVDRVLEEVRTLVAAAPDRPDLRWFLTNTLIDAGRLDEAVEHIEAIFEADPGELKSVMQAYERVLARDGTNVAANHGKGVLLKAQGRFEEARPLLERAVQLNPGHADAQHELADLYGQILAEGENVALRFALGKTYLGIGDHDRAIAQFQRTQQDFRYENESIKMLGLCFAGKGMLDFALTEFKKLVIDEEMKGILYDLGERYLAKNSLVGAKEVFKILFATDINYRDVKLKFDMLKGSTSDPLGLESSAMMTQLSERARRRYELLQEIGRGAMGLVFKARDNELDEIVALKILPENLSQNPEALARFRAEARSARRLAHPNIVRIHDIGEEMGRRYISMEFVPGGDLKKHFRAQGGPLPPTTVVRLMTPVAAALEYAHSMGIVHRDVKPANIMLTENMLPKVSDFGIAKVLEATGETQAGAVIGTPMYMSPEQVRGEAADTRADIYSLGVMMYELATGRPPFHEGDLAYQHVHVQPRACDSSMPELDAVIMRCLRKNRDERHATMEEVRAALAALPSAEA